MPICILCTAPTKTKEHIFPAAMGGRRENSKIYCEYHNNRLGDLVVILQKQMAFANALISVRGDRDCRPKAFTFDADDGDPYEMLNGDFSVIPPSNIEDIPVQENGNRLIKVASNEQFSKWEKNQKKRGWNISVSGPKEVVNKYHAAPFHITQSFGGEDFLRAVGYLALTFFAVYFGDEARQDSLSGFKEFVTTTSDPAQHVWWDARDVEATVGVNKYLFGHTIVVGVSQETGHAYGLVSFFSAFTFGIDFGPVNSETDVEYVVNIDPKAEWAQPGVDVFDVKNESPHVVVEFSPSDLATMVETGSAGMKFGRFLSKARDWRLKQDASQIMEKLIALQNMDATARLEGTYNVMAGQKQRVLNLLTEAAESIQSNLAIGEMAFMSVHAKGLIVPDATSPDGLAEHSSEYVDQATNQIAREIYKLMSDKDLTTDKIAMLIDGGLGLGVVMRQVLFPAIGQALTASGDARGAVLSSDFKAKN